jgi:hypothetical protein
MAFNINEFKAKMDQYGGPARTNLFVVSIFTNSIDRPTNQFMPDGDLRFFCQTATFPGINLTVTDYKPFTYGLKQSIPTGIEAEPVNCVFMLDSDHKVLSFFHEWMQRIVNYDVSAGNLSSVDNQFPYEINYKKEYTASMEIRFFSSDNPDNFYICTLNDVFPTQIGSLSLSWAENDQVATLPVNFSYSSMRMQAARVGTPTERLSRGTGYLQQMTSIGGLGQSIVQRILPTSVQDAINRFTTVSNTFDRLKSLFK